jgi:hypothetical protein
MHNTDIQNDELFTEAEENYTVPEPETQDMNISSDTVTDSEAEAQPQENSVEEELKNLREQVKELSAQLVQKQEEAERVCAQINDFYSLFPSTSLESIPDTVWESVKQGNSLAAAYAIYHRRLELKQAEANKINTKNAALSAGNAGQNTASEYYTPQEVRAMSQSEVRANYQKIIESMKKWN